jgi:predicted neutral ceramidase superfamily lipid hydrolase
MPFLLLGSGVLRTASTKSSSIGRLLKALINRAEAGWSSLFFLITLLPLLLFTDLLHINSILSSTFSLLLIAVLTWILRPDLLKPSIVSGILVMVLFFLVYKVMQVIFPSAIEYWCMGCNPLGLRISGINIEELLWDFSWGLAGGTMVEAVTGEKLKKLKSATAK